MDIHVTVRVHIPGPPQPLDEVLRTLAALAKNPLQDFGIVSIVPIPEREPR